jgi:hypothetical protein
VVILPSSHLDILNRSEAQVSGHPRFEIIQPWYTMARDKKVCESTIAAGFGLVWRYLTKPRDVEKYLSVVDEEFSSSFDEYWGANSGADWVPRKVFEMCAQVVARTANRMYFGLPLCKHTACVTTPGLSVLTSLNQLVTKISSTTLENTRRRCLVLRP